MTVNEKINAMSVEENKIYNIDCVEGMRLLPDNYIDLTVTSPPYDNLRKYNGYTWDFEATARELYRVTKDGGVVVWIVNDATINGSETGTSFRQALYFKECGFKLHDTMIWQKTNPMPNPSSNRYIQSFEYVFVFTKSKLKTFNPIMLKTKNAGKKLAHTIIKKDGTRIHKSGGTYNNLKKHENIFCYIIGTSKHRGINHPAVFPEQLAKDHIISWSNEGDIVLDCFMGSGTTAVAAAELNRKFIGFEISKEYCEIANKRLESEVQE